MSKNSESLNHGIHNEEVCDYLELKVEFSDWIITTAFYAALKFVTYKIFPFKVPAPGGKKTNIESVDDFYRYGTKNLSKHELLSDLVSKHCSSISPDYDWLMNMSMTARYSNYRQDRAIANRARSLMKVIKKHCTA